MIESEITSRIRRALPELELPHDQQCAPAAIGGTIRRNIPLQLVLSLLLLAGLFLRTGDCCAAVKPYSQCSSASDDPYERSAARIYEAMTVIEQELPTVVAGGKASGRLKDAIKDLESDLKYMKDGAERGEHYFPPPDLSGLLKICATLPQQDDQKLLQQFDDKIKELERRREIAKTAEKKMIEFIGDAQANAIIDAVLAVVTSGASAAIGLGFSAFQLIMQVADQINSADFAARDYVTGHKEEITRRLMNQIDSKPPDYRDRLKEVLEKSMSGKKLSFREKNDAKTLTLMTLEQIKYTARDEKNELERQIEQTKKDREDFKKSLPSIKDAQELCDRIRAIPLWVTFKAAPVLVVTKAASVPAITPGQTVTYSISVSNKGNCKLTNVRVDDSQCSPLNYTGGDDGDQVLDIGETWTYDCTVTLTTTGTVNNTVTVAAVDPAGKPVTTKASATVKVTNKLVAVPDVYSLKQSTAEYDIRQVKLKPLVAGTEKGDVSTGRVSRQSPAAGTMVPVGAVCSLWVATAEPRDLILDPRNVTILQRDTAHFKATLVLDDGSGREVTKQALWEPGPSNIYIGKEPGKFTITASHSGLSGSATVTVKEREGPDWGPAISHADDTLAHVPLAGPADYTWYVLCKKGKGEVVYAQSQDPTQYLILEGPFEGPRTAEKWIKDNCPSWRCTLDGECAKKPARGGNWKVICDKATGEVTLGEGRVSPPKTILAEGFLGEPDARTWVESNCSRWRCTQDGACATQPAKGGKWMAICDKETGEVTIAETKPQGLRYVTLDEGFLGEPDVRKWVDDNCPRWRCTAEGVCAKGPAKGGDWYAFCSGDGEIQLGHGDVGIRRNRLMAEGFLGESDARLWVERNCPSWHCNAQLRCLESGAPDRGGKDVSIDQAIKQLSPDASSEECDKTKTEFESVANELDGIAERFDGLSAYFDQQLRSFGQSDPRTKAIVCKDANIAYALTNAQYAAGAYDASYGSLSGLYGGVAAACAGNSAGFASTQAEYQRLSERKATMRDTYSRMLGDFGSFECDEQSSQTDAGSRADDNRQPDDVNAGVEVCGDGIDNDNDGEIDECDAGCCDKAVQITVFDCGSAADDIFLVAVDGAEVGVTPKGQSNTFNLSLTPGSHTVTITCLDDGGIPFGSDIGTACLTVTIYGNQTIGGSELAIAYGGSADVGFVVPEQQTVPPFPKVIDGSSLRGVE